MSAEIPQAAQQETAISLSEVEREALCGSIEAYVADTEIIMEGDDAYRERTIPEEVLAAHNIPYAVKVASQDEAAAEQRGEARALAISATRWVSREVQFGEDGPFVPVTGVEEKTVLFTHEPPFEGMPSIGITVEEDAEAVFVAQMRGEGDDITVKENAQLTADAPVLTADELRAIENAMRDNQQQQ